MRINVSIDASDLKAINAYCKETGIARSRFLVRSSLIAIQEMESGKEVSKGFEGFSKLDPKTETFISPKRKKIKVSDELVDDPKCKHGRDPDFCLECG